MIRGDKEVDEHIYTKLPRTIELSFHKGKESETYNIGGFNEWKKIDIIRVLIDTVDRLLGRREDGNLGLIIYDIDRLGHDRYYEEMYKNR